jgi:phosphonoacetaldehyde hydrolase
MTQAGVRAVLFDLSGTVIDYGSRGPALAFVELFARHGVEVTMAEARAPMGRHKRDHVQAMLADPGVRQRWIERHGGEPGADVLESLYEEFAPLQRAILRGHHTLIVGVTAILAELKSRSIRYAATTGFDSSMIDELIPALKDQGFEPEALLTPDLVGGGRPAPWMAFECARRLGIYPMGHIVKVGDTAVDVEEGRNAGMWTVSVVRSSNELGLSEAEAEALNAADENERVSAARKRLQAFNPHYVVDRITDLTHVLDRVSIRIERGEKP